jgi:hypothetical protein
MPRIKLAAQVRIALEAALREAFPTEADFRMLVNDAGRNLDQVSGAGQKLPTRVFETLGDAEANDWVLTLLNTAVQLRPADPALRAVAEVLKPVAPSPTVSPFHTCRLGSGTVMVDRKPLRAAVEELHDVQGRRILVITGESWSGKSHSLQLIAYIADVVGGFSVVEIDLDPRRDEQTRRVIGARDLAERLVHSIGYQVEWPDIPTDRQWSKWVIDFGDAFSKCARLDPMRRWIVIDGMNKVMLDQPAVDLVQDLALRVYKTLGNLRLVLVGYEQSLPSQVLPYIQEEKVARIIDNDLIEFFVLALQELNRQPDQETLADIVYRVLNEVDMTASDYLVKLGPLVAHEVLQIKMGRP